MSGVAIVTGGSRGIGRAAALELASAGWLVGIAGRDQAALDAVCAEGGDGLMAVRCDVTNQDEVVRLFDAVAGRHGRIDLLFNNAGVSRAAAPIADTALEDWSAVMDVNVTGAFLCAREAFRRMAAQEPRGGRIINNGSLSAHVPRPYLTPYTVSKHAITGLTRSLSLEGRDHDIACGQIDIGNAATELIVGMASAPQADGSVMPEPTIDVQHVAAAVLHMASLPLSANVQFMTIMATKMPYIGRG